MFCGMKSTNSCLSLHLHSAMIVWGTIKKTEHHVVKDMLYPTKNTPEKFGKMDLEFFSPDRETKTVAT